LVESGRVEVDGQSVTKLGTTVDPNVNKIRVDGVPLRKQKLVYYAVNKPVGYVTTNADPQGRARVIELVPKSERVFPVGRLDRNSEGLILLTNDGELAQQLSHPKFGVQKVYRVTVAGKVDGETMKQMRQGIYIAEGHVHVEGARILKSRSRSTELEIVLREGKNREIRRILARLGHKVQHLRRIAVGPLRLGDLPPGAYRPLHYTEVQKLQALVSESAAAGTDRGKRGPRKPGKRGAKKRVGSRPPAAGKKAKQGGKGSAARSIAIADRPARSSAVIGGDSPAADERTPSKKRAAKKGAGKKGAGKRGGKKNKGSRSSGGSRGGASGSRGGAKKSSKNPRNKKRSTKKRKRS
jgi:23S rRNA pseudouridine2605 synthase